ncbi:MAG: class I SAM-dependent methyltransferase [Ahniella sp.]|nr:class I SAM-dependent methyltransferase [Ahniella sp.]
MNNTNLDPALDSLLLPLTSGAITPPIDGRTLFLRARPGADLRCFLPEQLVCEQSFKPEADRLLAAGFTHNSAPDERFGLVLVLPPRSRDEARILFAQALQRVRADGVVVACAANNQGARSLSDDLEKLAGPVSSLSKHKCRVFWTTTPHSSMNADLMAEWLELDAPYPLADRPMLTRAGVFSAGAIDPASQLLIDVLPQNLKGRAADLGAGCGYLSQALITRNPGITSVNLYEAEQRALDVARINLSPHTGSIDIGFHWHDVCTGLPAHHDVIVMNPPFHQGRADTPDLGRAFIVAAARSLVPGGQLWLVANRHLPYESVLAEHFAQVTRVCEQDGFKVIAAHRSSGPKS